ncbi:MAG: penicillin-binding protein 2 [Sphingomonadales bacterium]|nr:penicillin-binding protein 2 [Sphingomonadales bacterium]
MLAPPTAPAGRAALGARVRKPQAPGGGRFELADMRKRAMVEAKWRTRWIRRAFTVVALGALAQVAHLGIVGKTPEEFSFADELVPERGDIVDRNGVPLARAFPAYSLWYRPNALGSGPPLVKTPMEVAVALNRIFPDMDIAQTAARLASGKPGYLRRRILPEEANRVHALGEPALEFPRENERYYPQGSMAAHVLGYVDAEGHGQVGMEQVFDARLRDRATRATASMLSLDARVQGALEDELARGMRDSAAKGAAGIVLDVDTGEVLALASLPSFNPNLIDQSGAANIFNRLTNQVYELGSTFKPITVASAIEAGTVTSMARRYPSGQPLTIDHRTIHDSHNFGASLNVPEALIHSSNIVLAQVGDELGGPRLNATLRTLGFDHRPVIELPAKGFPIWPRGDWSRITTMTVSYGHGMAVTPLHLASAYAAMVNGGVWHPATLRKFAPGEQPESRRVWKASTSARMRQLLRLIVDIGTGKSANAVGFRVGGKTGTAEKNINGHYQRDKVVATFAAAFPMDHPRYVVLALIDEPHATAATSGQRTAAFNAAPVVGRVVPRIGPLLGVMPDPSHDIDLTDLAPLVASGDGE